MLLSAPRRSAGVPSPDGKLALYTVSTYSFESHIKTSEIRVLDINNGQSTLVTSEEKSSEPHWIGEDSETLLWLKEGDKGVMQLVVGKLKAIDDTYVAGVLQGPVENVKLKVLGEGKVAIAFTGKARPDGSLYNPENEPKKYSSGLIYDSLMVRHWDKYVSPNRNAIWYGLLHRSSPTNKYSLSNVTNALTETYLESPIPPFGGTDHFDLGTTGIAFVAKDPGVNPAINTKANFYFLPISNFAKGPSLSPLKVVVSILNGACSSPSISPDGRSAVFLQMKNDGYESDKNRIIVLHGLSSPTATEIMASDDGEGLWDRSPSAVSWSNDGQKIYLQAEDEGHGLLYSIDVKGTPHDTKELPEKLTHTGYISDIQPLAAGSNLLFISSTNLIDNSIYTILDPSQPSSVRQISSNSRNGTSFNLSPNQVSSIWFPGANKHKVHAWVMKPSHFNSSQTYPLAYLIHGGPQGAWNDQWSTRWNPAVFAEQGYIVITPNPTGSTGYGQAFTDAIRNSWGGLPYEDLELGFQYIKENMPFVDTDRAVALGASYGGYMMNWIQGHPLGRRFKALVCHDGVFSMTNQMSSDEQYFPNHDLGGPYWRAMENWEKWNPARFTGEWKTPQLVIHNELDYRLPISEGLAVFNVLQERGVESRFLTFPDENHWVLKEENSLVWHTVVLNWINKFVGLPAYKEEGEMGVEVQSRPLVGEEFGAEVGM